MNRSPTPRWAAPAGRSGRGRTAPRRRLRQVAALAAVAALTVCLTSGWGSAPWWAAPVLSAVLTGCELTRIHLPVGSRRWGFSLGAGVLGAGWLRAPGAWSVVALVLAVAVAHRIQGRSRAKLEYPAATAALAGALGQLAVRAAGPGLPGVVLGLAVLFLVDHALVALAVSLASRRPLRALLLSSTPPAAVQTAGNCAIALLASFLAVHASLGLLGLLVPLGLLWASYDSQARRGQEVRLFADLADGQEKVEKRSGDASVQVLVTSAARVFGGADVELVVLAADGPVRYAGVESGRPERLRVDAGVFDEPWVLRALGAGGVATGVEDGRPWCSLVLGEAAEPSAVLIARRFPGAAPFGRREIRLARVLAVQAQSWLAIGSTEHAAAPGDLARATAPALTVLRESTERLGRLTSGPGAVDAIVAELHLVERAVASLLGAVARHAEPALPAGEREPALATAGGPGHRDGPQAPGGADDWTTTGVLP